MEVREIDEDPVTGDPIFEVRKENGSRAVFCFPPEEDGVRVLWVGSEEEGDMKEVMDKVVNHFGVSDVVFFNIIDTQLAEKLHGFEYEERVIRGEHIHCAVGEWEVD